MKKSLKITVLGKVQGVGYREFVQKQAQKMNIVGTVQNNPNGEVIIYATGSAESLESLIDVLYQGSSKALVKDVIAESLASEKDFRGVFRVIGDAE